MSDKSSISSLTDNVVESMSTSNINKGIARYALVIMLFLVIICIICYFYYMYNLNARECKIMDSMYSSLNNRITNLNFGTDETTNYTLKDYYIQTAYNCCSGGSYRNDYVGSSCCVLKDILKQGVRGLDFEIYSIDDVPVVATSTLDNDNIKETYNSLPFVEVMDTIISNAFSTSTSPNPKDPIVLHFRIKSTNQKMLTNLAAILKANDSRLLGPEYSYEYNLCVEKSDTCYSRNLGDVKLKDLTGKIIIIVDRLNTAFVDNENFYEFVNMTSNSMFMRALRYYDVAYAPSIDELTEYNKKNMTICMPDVGENPPNPNGIVARQLGCQMIAMRYQLFDSNLKEGISFFDKVGYAFALKPEKLRYIPIMIEETPPNDPLLNFAPRTISKDYYTFDI